MPADFIKNNREVRFSGLQMSSRGVCLTHDSERLELNRE